MEFAFFRTNPISSLNARGEPPQIFGERFGEIIILIKKNFSFTQPTRKFKNLINKSMYFNDARNAHPHLTLDKEAIELTIIN